MLDKENDECVCPWTGHVNSHAVGVVGRPPEVVNRFTAYRKELLLPGERNIRKAMFDRMAVLGGVPPFKLNINVWPGMR